MTHDEVLLPCWPCAICLISHPVPAEMHGLHAIEAKLELVCQHHNGFWITVSAHQSGEQTAIKSRNDAVMTHVGRVD